jgi:uncharacterized protein DUF3754
MRDGLGGLEQFEKDERDQYIPVRKTDILNALEHHGLIAGAEAREKFRNLCRLMGAIFHYEFFDRLEKLRDDYHYFNPEIPADGRVDTKTLENTRAELVDTLEDVLKGANYVEVPLAEVTTHTHAGGHVVRVDVETPLDDYHQVRFFRRGHHKETVSVRKWFGLRQREIETWVYDNVVLMVTIKLENEITSKRQLRRMTQSRLRPGGMLIKYFRNISCSDLNMLLPKVRVVMSLFDKLTIAVPALAGGLPLLINVLPMVTVLFLVAGFYLGVSTAVQQEDVIKAFAALTGVAALGGLILRQRLKYERLSLRYQKQISDHFYFRNVSNNAGIFDYIVGAAEEQECKEAFLAYYFLLTAGDAPDQATLDARIEQWLRQTFGVDIDFEVDDGLAKLARLELLQRDGERLSVVPLDDALVRLDRRWDNFFLYANRTENALS